MLKKKVLCEKKGLMLKKKRSYVEKKGLMLKKKVLC